MLYFFSQAQKIIEQHEDNYKSPNGRSEQQSKKFTEVVKATIYV